MKYLGLVGLFRGSLCGYWFMMSIVFVYPLCWLSKILSTQKQDFVICKDFDVMIFPSVEQSYQDRLIDGLRCLMVCQQIATKLILRLETIKNGHFH